MMEEFFYELFVDLPRQGPGDVLLTRKCFEAIADLQHHLNVLDVGCGTGFQTLYVASHTEFSITAVDNYQVYLDQLKAKAHELGLENRLQTSNMDMNNLDFADHTFDIILAEGSIYLMGIEQAIQKWKRLLKPGRFIIFSDICWTKAPQSQEIIDFWNQEYPDMKTLDQVDQIIEQSGYKKRNRYALDVSGWVNNYYYPLQLNVNKAKVKYKNQPEILSAIEPVQQEIDLFYKYKEYYTYYFYVIQLKP